MISKFSWSQSLIDVQNKKIARAKIQAKAQHPDFKLAHPDESRDANNNQFTKLAKRVKDEVLLLQKQSKDRMEKRK